MNIEYIIIAFIGVVLVASLGGYALTAQHAVTAPNITDVNLSTAVNASYEVTSATVQVPGSFGLFLMMIAVVIAMLMFIRVIGMK